MRRLFLVLLFLPIAALAQNNRSAVSINGSDTNPCTPASPCRSFAAAMNQTSPGGEIIAIDSAGYGPFTIDRWVTVTAAPGVHAAITVNSGIGITATPSAPVTIRNLVLIGNGGTVGIQSAPAALLRVINCVIRGFSSTGIYAGGTAVIERTAAIDNTSGIDLANGAQSAGRGVITNSTMQGNTYGVIVRERTSAVVKDSVLTGNTVGAAALSALDGASAEVTLENCTIAHNSGAGVQGNATGIAIARVFLSQNVIAYNAQGVLLTAASAFTFNNNRFVGNTTDGGPFSSVAFE
jgi:hypothetical protein